MSQQLCTFHVADLYLGIAAERVQEILRPENLTPVPLAPRAVSGLINLRGQIVTAIDLRRQLDAADDEAGAPGMAIILSNQGGAIGLLVDRLGEVVDVEEDDFEAPPDNLRGSARRMIEGAYKLEDRLLLILNTSSAIEIGEQVGSVRDRGGMS